MCEAIKAKQVYARLRQSLAPILKSNGFKSSKLSPLAWTKPHLDQHLSLWFQMDKNGWFDELGSSFTLEFQHGPDPHQPAAWKDRIRYFSLLSSPDQELLRQHNNQVFLSLPELDPQHLLYASMKYLRTCDSYGERPEPYEPREDVWLRYHRTAHLDFLADFLAPRILPLLDLFCAQRVSASLVDTEPK